MKILGVIPARSGSKRVEGKNVKPLAGKPLIQYTIEAANASAKLFDTIVSTDSQDIADIAERVGGKSPFLRPAELATDGAGDRDVLAHAIKWYEENVSEIDAVCYLRPTSPLRQAVHIDAVLNHLEDSGADSVRSVTKVEGVHHPYWMYTRNEEGKVVSAVPNITIEEYYQSQLLPPVFRLNGVVDVIRKNVVLDRSLPLYGNTMELYELDEAVSMDIDTEEDFAYCEWLVKSRGF